MNDHIEPKRELKHRIAQCMTVWKKLDVFWLHSTCSPAFKLYVYDAVIRSKLLYGLEGLQLTEQQELSLNTFQLKGLRKILRIKTTFVDHANTNDF
eukprot:11952627-Prorocentrum_lima.AAC.1